MTPAPGRGEGGIEELEAAGVAWFAGECCFNEDTGEADRVRDGVHPGPQAQDVGVVVEAREARRLLGPGDGGADAADLVGRDLLPVPGAADPA